MNLKVTTGARDRALAAIEILHPIIKIDVNWELKELTGLRRGIGLSIGTIEVDLLRIIYEKFPDLDDLQNPDF